MQIMGGMLKNFRGNKPGNNDGLYVGMQPICLKIAQMVCEPEVSVQFCLRKVNNFFSSRMKHYETWTSGVGGHVDSMQKASV